jgi:tetratricopeptide (TPR) repeat protein
MTYLGQINENNYNSDLYTVRETEDAQPLARNDIDLEFSGSSSKSSSGSLWANLQAMGNFVAARFQSESDELIGFVGCSGSKSSSNRAPTDHTPVKIDKITTPCRPCPTGNKQREELKLPHYYQLAHDKPGAVLKYYLKFYGSYQIYKSFYQNRRAVLNFSEAGFDYRNPSKIVAVLSRLLKTHLIKKDLRLSFQIVKDLPFLMGKLKNLPDTAQKDLRLSAQAMVKLLKEFLALPGKYKVIGIIKSMNELRSAVDLGASKIKALKMFSKEIEKLYSGIIKLLYEEVWKRFEADRVNDAEQISEGLSSLIYYPKKISERDGRFYLELMQTYIGRGEYNKAIELYESAMKMLGVKRLIRSSREDVLAIYTDYKRTLMSSYSALFAENIIAANRSKAQGGRLNIMKAKEYYAKAEQYLAKYENLTKNIRIINNSRAKMLMGLAGLYEIDGKNREAVKIYKKIRASFSVSKKIKVEARMKIAFLKGDAATLESISQSNLRADPYRLSEYGPGLEPYPAIIKILAKLSVGIKRARENGQPGLATTHLWNSLVVKKFRDYHLFYDVNGHELLTIVRGKTVKMARKRILFPPDSGRRFTILFKGFWSQVMKNHGMFVYALRRFPKGFYKGLTKVIFTGEAGASSASGTVVTYRVCATDSTSTPHEMAHVWDSENSGKMKLFKSISWEGELRKEEDQRDFETTFGECDKPLKYNYIKPTNRSIRKEYRVCSKEKEIPYGMNNSLEDFATSVGSYFNDGNLLRAKVNKYFAFSTNNLEPILKYLFVKHLTPFDGKEYGIHKPITKPSQGISLARVDKRLRKRLKNHPRNKKVKWALGIIDKIKLNMTKRKR